METRVLGHTGLMVSRLGLGLSEIGSIALDLPGERAAGQVLNAALDGGITFLDTSGCCYGNSEELIGRTDEVDTMIVGARNADHLRQNIILIETRLPLAGESVNELHRRFAAMEAGSVQLT